MYSRSSLSGDAGLWIQRANYEGLEHPWILVPTGVLEPIPHEHWGITVLSSASSHPLSPHQEQEWLMECSAQEAGLEEGPSLLLDTQPLAGWGQDYPQQNPRGGHQCQPYFTKNTCQ